MGIIDALRTRRASEEKAVAEATRPLQERLASLELALEDRGWVQMGIAGELEFSRSGLERIVELARLMYRANPLINRGVELQKLYVWSDRISVACEDERAKEVIDALLSDEGNLAALFGQEAAGDQEKELQVTGNVFIACFLPASKADVLRVRTIPFEEVQDKVCNPDDRTEPWYYKRVWSAAGVDPLTGAQVGQLRTAWYPDLRYRPEPADRAETIAGAPVLWDVPLLHLSVGGFPHDAFGTSEVYAALAWARAHKENLEAWAAITKAHARFAWRAKVAGGAKGVAAAKAKLTTGETTAPPTTGSVLIEAGGNELTPIKTAGTTDSPEDSKWLLLQVCAALGLPEFFFGNSDVGNYATSKTLDRPTEMKFEERRRLWAETYVKLCRLACEQAEVALDEAETPITATFPPLLEHDVETLVSAYVKAITLDGKQPLVIPDVAEVARLLFGVLGIEDADALHERLFPDGEASTQLARQEAALVAALGDLRERIAGLAVSDAA